MNKTTFVKCAFIVAAVPFLTHCASTPNYQASCQAELSTAWKELSLSEAKGFKGTVSYTQALSYITAARTMETAGKYESCYNQAKQARVYIRDSYKGK